MTNSVAGWRSSKPLSKAKLAPKKIMVTVWWSSVGLIHCSFLNPGETITSEKYAQQINEMHWKLQSLQPALVNRKGPILLHDNAQWHVAQPMLQKLNELSCEVLPHPPYSLALSPAHGQRSLAGYSPWDHKEPDTTEELSLHFTHQQTTTSSSISTTFLQGKYFHNQQNTENAFQEFVESQSRDF